MAIPEKEKMVSDIAEQLKRSKGIYFTDFSGLNVDQITELRSNFRKAGIEFRVVKNTLAKLSAKQVGLDRIADHLTGPTAIAFGINDSLAPVKIISDFAKKIEKPKIKLGWIEGEIIQADEIESIAKIPPKEVLIGQVVSGFAAPISGLVSTLNNILQSFVGTIEAYRLKKEKESGQL